MRWLRYDIIYLVLQGQLYYCLVQRAVIVTEFNGLQVRIIGLHEAPAVAAVAPCFRCCCYVLTNKKKHRIWYTRTSTGCMYVLLYKCKCVAT